MKKRLPEVVGVASVLLLIGLVVFLYFRTREIGPQPEVPPAPVEAPVEGEIPILTYQGEPVKKGILTGEAGLRYELEGSFPSGLHPSDQEGFLTGNFVLKGDPLERGLKVMVGSVDGGYAFFGTYEGDFWGKARWISVPIDEVAREIKPGEPVRIAITYLFGEWGYIEYFKQREALLDGLALEYKENEYKLTIPSDLMFIPERVGVIR